MFQKEFAQRLYAEPGVVAHLSHANAISDFGSGSAFYCRLSVNSQLLARVSHLLKVGRNNFRPPPVILYFSDFFVRQLMRIFFQQVDSAVVRLEPRSPPPPINFVEWDGLIRLCFNRKNKTLGAIFAHKSVTELIASNHRTYCALHNVPVTPDMDFKKKVHAPRNRSGKDLIFWSKVNDVLVELGFADKRSAKLDLDDFIKLLEGFTRANIRFC
jgi:18S rRNA (adenine1779-N6/adenine1780-N6)-dimethyltransferase